jgi:hypothetical protein
VSNGKNTNNMNDAGLRKCGREFNNENEFFWLKSFQLRDLKYVWGICKKKMQNHKYGTREGLKLKLFT